MLVTAVAAAAPVPKAPPPGPPADPVVTVEFPPAARAAGYHCKVELAVGTAAGVRVRHTFELRTFNARQACDIVHHCLNEQDTAVAVAAAKADPPDAHDGDGRPRRLTFSRCICPDGAIEPVTAVRMRVADLSGGRSPLPTARGAGGVEVTVEVGPAAALDAK